MVNNSYLATNTLSSLINDYSTSIINDPIRFENLLLDYYRGENRKEASILIFSLKEKIPEDLINNKDIPYAIHSKSLINRLVEHGGYSEENAKWAVDTWAYALKLESVDVFNSNRKNSNNNYYNNSNEKSSIDGTADITKKSDLCKVKINTIPTGAKIYINNTLPGNISPFHVDLPNGKYSLIFLHENCDTKKLELTINGESEKNILEILSKSDTVSTKKFGGLEIGNASFPSGAKVYLNSRLLGTIPLKVWDIIPGEYLLKTVMDGYETDERRIIVEKDICKIVNITLVQPSGYCGHCSKPLKPLDIFTCRYCGIDFCGEHRLPSSHSCKNIDVWKKKTNPHKRTNNSPKSGSEPSIKLGGLEIDASSSPRGAKVYMDSMSLGTLPINYFNTMPGEHLLKTVMDGYQTDERKIMIESNFCRKVTITLKPLNKRNNEKHDPFIFLFGVISFGYLVLMLVFPVAFFGAILGFLSTYILYTKKEYGRKFTYLWLGMLTLGWLFAGNAGYLLAVGHLYLAYYFNKNF